MKQTHIIKYITTYSGLQYVFVHSTIAFVIFPFYKDEANEGK